MGRRQIGCNIDVATKEAKSTVGLGCDVVDMLVPAQVVTREISGHRGTWQRRRLHVSTDDRSMCKDTARSWRW